MHVWPHHRQSCMIRPKPMLITFRIEIKNLTLDYYVFMLIFNRCFSKYIVHHRERYVVKPIEGWGFSSDRRGILDQVYCCKHCFLFELIQLPTCLRKRFTSVFILWRLHFKHQKGPGRQTDRQLAVGLKSCSVSSSSSSSFSASPPAVCCYCCSTPSGFTYRSQWRTGHVASPANDLTGLIVPFIC